MLIEEMYQLPLGVRVRSVEPDDKGLTGLLESGPSGTKHVRWSNGTRTVDFPGIREDDEFIASSIRVDSAEELTGKSELQKAHIQMRGRGR